MNDIRTAWESKPYRSVAGLSKDGRPIYGPFYGNKQEYKSCDVDVCNGMTINGEYAYVSTFFHPYIQGCFGPGNMPDYSQQCSSNPRNCNSLTDFSNNRGGGGPGNDERNGPPGKRDDTFSDIISIISGATITKSTILAVTIAFGIIQI